MELVKDIYFNTDKLIENTDVKVSYTGKFYQGNNDKVYLHYGYGKDWNNLTDVEMTKTDLGYQAELKLTGENTINFCFKNQNNEWDNNCGNNYIFNIEKLDNTSGVIEDVVTSTPNSIDAVLSNKAQNAVEQATITKNLGVTLEKPAGNDCFAVIKPTTQAQKTTTTNTTSITIAPTGFAYWTKKIKANVCKFFDYLPKLISGNYKRDINTPPTNNKK